MLFIAFLPAIVNRISIIQTDNELIDEREQVIGIISDIGIEPFIADSINTFGSYNILKQEFISLEKTILNEDWNFIEIDERELDNETIEYRVLNYSFDIDGETYLLQIGRSLESIVQTKYKIRNIILVFLIFFILVTLISDLLYTDIELKPLSQIVDKLKNTSTPELFDRKPVRTSTYDFVKLDKAITALMNRIKKLISREREITANMSHELLTPVSVIRGKLENILLHEDLDPELSEKVEDSLKTLHRLKTLINSLLFFSRIESQQYLKGENFEISDLISSIYDELSPISADKGINLVCDTANLFSVKDANRSLMFSMIYNVVNNAIKNTDKGGMVIIKIHNDAFPAVSVTDNGSGIEPEKLNDLFSRFRKKQSDDGNGIGLAITKSIADFHKIEIGVESKLGQGTQFYFRFPENS
jgi:signal transduction histidine kinase